MKAPVPACSSAKARFLVKDFIRAEAEVRKCVRSGSSFVK